MSCQGRCHHTADLHSISPWTPSQRRYAPCRGRAIAVPNSTSPSWLQPRLRSSGHQAILPQHHAAILLASHQLFMMTMASHHRRRHHADSSCGSFTPPSSHSGTAWPPTSFLHRRPPSRMKSVAPQPTPSQRRSPRTILSWMTSSRRRSSHHLHLAASHRNRPPAASRRCQPSPRAQRHAGHHSRRHRRRRHGSTRL